LIHVKKPIPPDITIYAIINTPRVGRPDIDKNPLSGQGFEKKFGW
jgi:hypothetical protein